MGAIPVIPVQNPNPIPNNPNAWTDLVSKQYLDKVLPSHERTLLGGMELRPKNVRFATQNKGEKVYILLRRHWFTNLSWVTNTVISALVPLVLYVIAEFFNWRPGEWVNIKIWTLVIMTYYALLITSALRKLIDWYFNLYIVTNERVIDYNLNVATTNIGATEMALENIEEVREQSIGIIPSVLNYGDVSIFSASDQSSIKFDFVPRPTFVRDIVSDLAKVVKAYTRDES